MQTSSINEAVWFWGVFPCLPAVSSSAQLNRNRKPHKAYSERIVITKNWGNHE